MTGNFDVVVVGGGAAGIGAARRLGERGLSTLLLEATARLGGRAWTHEVAGVPLDLGCGWLHSGDRNAWVGIADTLGFAVDRGEPPWGKPSARWLHPDGEQKAARQAFDAWSERLHRVAGTSDRASDALEPDGLWNPYVRAVTGFISGVGPEAVSAADYLAYDAASTGRNWRVPLGYGRLVAAGLPVSTTLRLATPAERIAVERDGIAIATHAGSIRARAAIVTLSTAVLAGDAIRLPAALDPWREAAALLPLGRNEKVFLEVRGGAALEADRHAFGSLHDSRTAAYHIRPFGRPIIEAFLGGDGARMLEEDGPAAGYAHAMDELAALFGEGIRASVRPLAASYWSRTAWVGGAYSCALPGHAAARARLARPYDDRIFFAGEATHRFDFSTAHGAHDSGLRAADEVWAALRVPA